VKVQSDLRNKMRQRLRRNRDIIGRKGQHGLVDYNDREIEEYAETRCEGVYAWN